MSFFVKQQSFEGPLDLLLSLIEKRKLFINDISLSKVADNYIEHVQSLEHFPIGDSANFILIASTLLLIKSKSLLPGLTLTEDEEVNIEDLALRLRIFKRIKEIGESVREIFGKKIIFTSNSLKFRGINTIFSPDESMTRENIVASIQSVLMNLPKKESLPQAIVKKVVSLEETITTLAHRIKSSLKISFKDFSSYGKAEKVNVIVSFLAMLELVKQGVIFVTQESHEGDITMETGEVGVPRY
ncbi:MAG: hypothetical protein EXS50_00360 [Candidatus Taylorbacteria bacterium]|nr:hypothetical protein [Candidatus Taylorbacteria bacterium]